MNSILKFVGAVVSLLVASTGTALAVDPLPIPEPGSLALFAVAAAAGVAAYLRGKKK